MKLPIAVLLLVFTTMHGYGQHTLTGRITDKDKHQPLIGAFIYIPDLQKGTTTGPDGSYEITGLPRGTFLIEVAYLGYGTRVIKSTIQDTTTLNVELAISITEMSEIVVTGHSASTERALNPIPTIVINDLSSGESSSTNIIDAIANEPGISQVTTGGAISKPLIRGLGYNRVVVLNNNIRQEGQQWGDEHGIEIDEYSVERVEIIKGPGSIMYGSDAMAGVIHFLPPKPLEPGRITGNLMANYQTNNGLMGFSAMNAGNLNGINWLARVSGKRAGNYQNSNDGKVYNSAFREFNFNGSLGINKRWGYSQVHFSRFDQKLGLIEGERDSSGRFVKPVVINDSTVEEIPVTGSELNGYQIDIPRQDIGHLKIASSSKFFLNNSILSLNLAFQQNSRKEFADPTDEDAVELFFLLNTFNYDLKYLLPNKKRWQTSIGVNGMQQHNSNKGEEFLIPEYNLFDAGLFAFTQKTLDKLHVSGGIRYDVRNIHSLPLYLNEDDEPTHASDTGASIKFNEFKTAFSNVSGSIGASYRFTNSLTGKLNISRGFRSPNMGELASNGIHEGTFRYELGNDQLQPETSLQFDGGLLYNTEHVSVEFALFHNAIDNYIYLQKLSSVLGGDSIMDPSEPAPVFQFVQGNANLYGGEFVIDIHPHPLDWLHFENSFSMVRGVQSNQPDSAKYLPFIPAPKIQSELRALIPKAGSALRSLYFMVKVEYNFRKTEVFKAFGTETETPSYTLLHAGMGTDVVNRKGKRILSITLTAENLLDVAYQSHLSRLKYAPENLATGESGVFNMGRNISLRVAVPITFKE